MHGCLRGPRRTKLEPADDALTTRRPREPQHRDRQSDRPLGARALRGHAPLHRHPAARGALLVREEPQQGHRGLRARRTDRGLPDRPLRRRRPASVGHYRRGVHLVSAPALHPLHHLGRHLPDGQPRGHPEAQCGLSNRRGDTRELHRHHGRLDGADQAPAQSQQRAHPRQAHRGVLHLRRQQHGRSSDASRRPTAVPRLPSRRPLHVDVPAVGRMATLGSPRAHRLPGVRALLLPQGARPRPPHGPRRLRAHAPQGRSQHLPARTGDRHGALLRRAPQSR